MRVSVRSGPLPLVRECEPSCAKSTRRSRCASGKREASVRRQDPRGALARLMEQVMRRVLFASTLVAVVGFSAVALDHARANDLACVRTSKGNVVCGPVLRAGDRTSSKRLSRRQRALQARIDGEGSRRTPHHSLGRRYGDDVVPGLAGLLDDFDPGDRTRHVDIPMPRQHPLRTAHSGPMPRQHPLRAARPEAVPRIHPRHVIYRQSSREFSGGGSVPPATRFAAPDPVTSGNSPRAEVRDQPRQEIDHGVAATLAQKAQSYRTTYPDLRPYEEDTRQPDESRTPRRDDRGKRPERE